MVKLKINGQIIEVPEKYTVLQAAASIGITIPTLCYHKDLSPFGGCRLCVVEVQNARVPMTACILPVSPGLQVQTDTPALHSYRRAILRMLLRNYYDACYKRGDGKYELDQDSELAHWARVFEIDIRSTMAKRPRYPVDTDPNPFVWVDMNKCIQCTRCVRACSEVQGRFVWSQSFRGYKARIVAGADTTMLQARCESCGACVVYCPTGALDNKMSVSAGRADRLVQTTCSYCGVGCQLDLNIKDDVAGGRVIRVTSHEGPSNDSVNGMHLCVKGRYGYEYIHSTHRHTKPRVRQYLLDGSPRPQGRGKWVDVDWETAIEIAARGLRQASERYGGESLGILASAKNTNEDNYLLNKLARQVLKTNNIDCSAHLYNGSEVDGLMEAVGLPAMSASFEDIANHARALLVIGSNLSEQHPVFGAQIRQAILRRKVKMVVASPDFINIAEYAALPLYHQPKTETALINGLMHIILQKGWEDHAATEEHTNGFTALTTLLQQYTPQRVAQITGLTVDSLYQAAELLAMNRPVAIIWGSGLAGQHTGQAAVQSLANLHRLLGGSREEGSGLLPMRGHNNLQGACDVGCLPTYLTGYQPVADVVVRQKFAQTWGSELPTTPGLNAAEMLQAAGSDQIKAMYIHGEEILNSTLAAGRMRRNLEHCEFIVLQEIQTSETTRYADVLLPGASFAEKSGTFTSAERGIQMVNEAIQPIGQAWPDWQITAALARSILGPGAFAGWEYANSAQIMQEIAALTPIYAGVSHARLESGERLQWPVESHDHPGTPRLALGLFSGGEVRWLPCEQPTPEAQPEWYPELAEPAAP